MKRTQRYLFSIMSALVLVWLLLTRLPPRAALWLLATLLGIALVLAVWGRSLLVGRFYFGRRNWRRAFEHYQRFERRLLASSVSGLAMPLYLGIYSLDGVAITRNQMAQSLLNVGDADGAEYWLRAALRRDPFYAVPYVYLGVLAALRKDIATAKREMGRAVELGYSAQAAQVQLSRALARAEAAGKVL
jgi:tetratricopeptide (TPR) repeat protein